MKVLHIIKSLGRGGAEMLLPACISMHDKASFEFHVIYFLPWKNQLHSKIEDSGAKVSCFQASSHLRILFKVPQIIRYCKRHNIDALHSHLPWAGFASRLVHLFIGIPLIYTEHNKQEHYHFVTRILNRLTFKWQNLVIAVSQDTASSIARHISASVPVKTILNGVNTQIFIRDNSAGYRIRKEHSIPEDSIVIGTIAVFREQKRLDLWIRVFLTVKKEFPSVRGILVGAGPLYDNIKDEIRNLGLDEDIIMSGLQTNTVSWLSAMDIYLMSSDFEGLPVAMLEAMSCGCTVVSTEVGGVPEVIRHNQDGLLAKQGDISSLACCIQDVIRHQDMRKKLGAAARLRVEQHFSLSSMVAELENVYNKMNHHRIQNS